MKKDTQRKQGACGGNQCPDIIPPVISSCIHHSTYTTQRLQDRSHTHTHTHTLNFHFKIIENSSKKKKKKKKKSPQKIVPNVGIELGAACIPSGPASDRATAPGDISLHTPYTSVMFCKIRVHVGAGCIKRIAIKFNFHPILMTLHMLSTCTQMLRYRLVHVYIHLRVINMFALLFG